MSRPPIVLASASPRRRDLLGELVADFTVDVADVDEEALTLPDPVATARRLAVAKAEAVAARHPGALVIGGDTVVALDDGSQLAKPRDADDARRMLRLLAGATHAVHTGVALVDAGGTEAWVTTTRVTFRALTDAEIADYVATGEPMDKAGAYGAQGMGGGLVARLDGSRSNVVGLPQESLREALRRRGIVG